MYFLMKSQFCGLTKVKWLENRQEINNKCRKANIVAKNE